MSTNLQIIPYPLTTQPAAPGGNAVYPMNQIPVEQYGRYAHLAGFLVEVIATPTFTTAPVLGAIYNLLKSIVFTDGVNEKINLSGWQLRNQVVQELNQYPLPQPVIQATGAIQYHRQFIPYGPTNLQGYVSDFIQSIASMKTGELRLNFAQLTDYSADTTAMTLTVKVTALIAALEGEIRIPPGFERRAYNNATTDNLIQGDALYNTHLLMRQDFSVIAAGSFGDVTVDTGKGSASAVPATQLTAVAQLSNLGTVPAGLLTQLRGDSYTATDVGEANITTAGNAVAATPAYIQSVISPISGGRISKLQFKADGGLRVKWSGTLTASASVIGRFLKQNKDAFATQAAAAAIGLGKGATRNVAIKTLSRKSLSAEKAWLAQFLPAKVRW